MIALYFIQINKILNYKKLFWRQVREFTLLSYFQVRKLIKLLKKQDGFVLLNAIYLISSSTISDVASLQTGLASLVKLGLINDFKSISNELLIMEYFKKNLG